MRALSSVDGSDVVVPLITIFARYGSRDSGSCTADRQFMEMPYDLSKPFRIALISRFQASGQCRYRSHAFVSTQASRLRGQLRDFIVGVVDSFGEPGSELMDALWQKHSASSVRPAQTVGQRSTFFDRRPDSI